MFICAKYALAFFSMALGLICTLIYALSTHTCDNYGNCFTLLAVFHCLDGLGYVHEGYKAANDGYGIFGSG